MMDITEDMVVHVCQAVLGTTQITYQGQSLSLQKGWRRLTMADAVREYAGLDFMAMDGAQALAAVQARGLEIEKGKDSWGDLLAQCFEEYVEDKLQNPTFIIDYPVEVSPPGQAQGIRPAPDRAV